MNFILASSIELWTVCRARGPRTTKEIRNWKVVVAKEITEEENKKKRKKVSEAEDFQVTGEDEDGILLPKD